MNNEQPSAIEVPETTTAPLVGVIATVGQAPPINMGIINARLGFTLTAQFIEDELQIGRMANPPTKTGVYWHAEQFDDICDALVQHIGEVVEP